MNTRAITTALFWFILLASLAGLTLEARQWLQTYVFRQQIMQADRIAVDDQTPSGLLLAKAWSLIQAGKPDAAKTLYDRLLHRPEKDMQAEAHYQLGTLYLKEAAPIWHAVGVLEYAKVSTLVALARQHLQAALRLQPTHWEARYNLEYAERITPPPREQEASRWRGSKSSVFATLPSLPDGAP